MEQKNMNSIVSWSGLVIGVIALLIAVNAHNRTGQDVLGAARDTFGEAGRELAEEGRETADSAQRQAAIIQAQARLTAIRADIEANRVTAETMNALDEVRRDLENVEFSTNVNLETQLDDLESQLRQGAAGALGTVESIIAALRDDVENVNN